jgi:hypothetical protein
MGKNGKATKFCVCIEPHNVISEKRPVAIITLFVFAYAQI